VRFAAIIVRTRTTVLGAHLAVLELVAHDVAAEGLLPAHAALESLDLDHAGLVPHHLAAEGVLRANTFCYLIVLTSRLLVGHATIVDRAEAVLGAHLAVFELVAHPVSAKGHLLTFAAVHLFDFRHADVVPDYLTAEGILLAHAGSNGIIEATGAFVGHAAILRVETLSAILRTALAVFELLADFITARIGFLAVQLAFFYGLLYADIIPGDLAAVGIYFANAVHNVRVFAEWRVLGLAAVALALAAVSLAVAAVFALFAIAVAAVSADILAGNALSFFAEVVGRAVVPVVAGEVGDSVVEALALLTVVLGAGVAVRAVDRLALAGSINALVEFGAGFTVFARDAIHLGNRFTCTALRHTDRHGALAHAVLGTDDY